MARKKVLHFNERIHHLLKLSGVRGGGLWVGHGGLVKSNSVGGMKNRAQRWDELHMDTCCRGAMAPTMLLSTCDHDIVKSLDETGYRCYRRVRHKCPQLDPDIRQPASKLSRH